MFRFSKGNYDFESVKNKHLQQTLTFASQKQTVLRQKYCLQGVTDGIFYT
jgi:hypothetical protein